MPVQGTTLKIVMITELKEPMQDIAEALKLFIASSIRATGLRTDMLVVEDVRVMFTSSFESAHKEFVRFTAEYERERERDKKGE